MRIHREGFRLIPLSAIILIALLHFIALLGAPQWLLIALSIPALVFFILIVRFFRNPKREADQIEGSVVSPCDGKVVVIEEVEETEYFNERRIQISIFMSPLNVHVNRNPISGDISYFRYHPGKYLVAWHPKSSTENERTTAVIKGSNGTEILFRQIAGAVARRIRWYIKKGDKVEKGKEMGFIKFGSRVDVFLPLSAEIKVSLNENVTGAESVLALI